MCINAASVGACDDRIDLPVGSWEVVTLEVHQRMLTKLGTVPARLRLFMGGYCKGGAAEAWVDDLLYFVNDGVPAACPAIEVKSEAVSRRSCYDHYISGARTDGVYRINRGGGAFSIWCDMTTGKGGVFCSRMCRKALWCCKQVFASFGISSCCSSIPQPPSPHFRLLGFVVCVCVVCVRCVCGAFGVPAGGGWDLVSSVVSAPLQFGVQRCTSLDTTCYGNINPNADRYQGSRSVCVSLLALHRLMKVKCGTATASVDCVDNLHLLSFWALLVLLVPGSVWPPLHSFAQDLGLRSDGEMLVLGRPGLFSAFTGFSTDPNGIGFLVCARELCALHPFSHPPPQLCGSLIALGCRAAARRLYAWCMKCLVLQEYWDLCVMRTARVVDVCVQATYMTRKWGIDPTSSYVVCCSHFFPCLTFTPCCCMAHDRAAWLMIVLHGS